jgi:predicted nucleic acid-binding protein
MLARLLRVHEIDVLHARRRVCGQLPVLIQPMRERDFPVLATSANRAFGQQSRGKGQHRWVASKVGTNVLSFHTQAALLAGRIESDLEKAGARIDAPDVMIAAIPICERLPLVTGNIAHFEAVRSVGYPIAIETWRNM